MSRGLLADIKDKRSVIRSQTSVVGSHVSAHSSLIGFSLAVLALAVFADTSAVETESQRTQTAALALVQSAASKQGLHFSVGNRGLDFALV